MRLTESYIYFCRESVVKNTHTHTQRNVTHRQTVLQSTEMHMAVTSLFINASSSKGQVLKRKTIDDYYFSLQSVLFRIYLPIVYCQKQFNFNVKGYLFCNKARSDKKGPYKQTITRSVRF